MTEQEERKALERLLWLTPMPTTAPEHADIADAILTSEWLKTHDAEVVARSQQEVETVGIAVGSRQSGKTRGLIDALLDRAGQRGIKVEIVESQLIAVKAAVDAERERCAQEVDDYWDACGELIDSNVHAHLGFEALAERIRELTDSGSER